MHASRKRKSYKDYNSDPNAAIPKTTINRWRTQTTQLHREQDADLDSFDTSLLHEEERQEGQEEELEELDVYVELDHNSSDDNDMQDVQDNCLEEGNDKLLFQEDPALYDQLHGQHSEEENMHVIEDTDNDADLQPVEMTQENASSLIYKGSQINLAVSMLLVITFVIRHGLSGEALTDLLTLIELHCIIPNCFHSSLKMFREFFKDLRFPIECHYYCPYCFSYWKTKKEDVCTKCQKNVASESSNYFIVLPLILQLQHILGNSGMYDSLQYSHTRKKKHTDNIEDIIDGKYYKTHFGDDGFFVGSTENQKSSEVHLSLQMNTDGVALFRSSKFSIWPVFFTVNELPPQQRYLRKNRIFGGLWFGNNKPNMEIFLQPFAVAVTELFRTGTTINFAGIGQKTVRALLVSVTADSPARCMLSNFVQFNGFFGCPFCLTAGETTSAGKGHSHTYTFDRNPEKPGYKNLRDHTSTLSHAKEAVKTKKPVNGVKGHSWLLYIPNFDMIRGMAIDYMHAVLLGVVKMLMTLWFNKSYSKEPWYIGNQGKVFDERYARLSPPNCISRAPRQIMENLSHWKASEFRTFLLYFSLPCLFEVLPRLYFQHYLLLVEAIFILDSDSISPSNLRKAEQQLQHFCLRVQHLYGRRYETFNMHLLLHLKEKVVDLGPLWCQSCFWYEDYNGDLRHLFHGSQKPEMQIILAVCIQQKIPEMVPILDSYPNAQTFYHHMSSRKSEVSSNNSQFISGNLKAVGTFQRCTLSEEYRFAVERSIGPFDLTSIFSFKRMSNGKDIIHSMNYKAVTCYICYIL